MSLSPLAASAYIQVYTAVAFPFRIYSYSRSCFDAFSHLLTDEAARKEVIFGYYRNKRAAVTQKNDSDEDQCQTTDDWNEREVEEIDR